MEEPGGLWSRIWPVLAVVLGVGLLMTLEVIVEPDLSAGEILFEMVDPTLIVMTAVGVVYLLGRVRRQHEEQMTLIRDLEVARAEGAQWRGDMRELLQGLGAAIDAQFDRWSLTAAEREVAMLLLKGLSHKEIAAVRGGSEQTARQQARAVYAKAKLSGRAALSAFFLEDLLLPPERSGGRPQNA
jgi:DNA-binding CsgD family transcriptional regulator